MTMMKQRRTVGLTSDPLRRKEEHGNPSRWLTVHKFRNEQEAHEWYRKMLEEGYREDEGGTGWEYGYTFNTPREKLQH